MSTKIYDAYLHRGDLNSAMTLLQPLRELFIQDVTNMVVRSWGYFRNYSAYLYDQRHRRSVNPQTFPLLEGMRNDSEKRHPTFEDELAVNGSVVLYPMSKKKTLIQTFFLIGRDAKLCNSHMKANFKYYGYWNNTDRDEECSAREWRQRKRDWDKVFPESGAPIDVGLVMELFSFQVAWKIQERVFNKVIVPCTTA